MVDFVLFSPIGRTDPTRGFHDGAFIHICRVYKPKKVYLYMSAEICKFDRFDNRYVTYLNKLSKQLGFVCSVIILRHEQLTDVHNFEKFYEDFTDYIRNIINENPSSEILLNLSSGTPQMKSALRIVCSMSNRLLIPIQVSSPEGKSNEQQPIGDDFDIDFEWEFNEDNKEEFINRCSIVKSENFNAVIKKEIISKHISAYDYRAAYSVVETISDYITKDTKTLIEAGQLRLSLDVGRAEMCARSAGFDLCTIKISGNSANDIKNAYEYILNLQIKLFKGEIADFIRGISPVLTAMFELYLKEQCDVDIKSYYKPMGPRSRKVFKLSRDYLPPDLLTALDDSFNGYRDSAPSAAIILPLISLKGDARAAEIANRLREIEERARNIAAHDIVAINEKWIKQKTGYETADILQMLKEFFNYCVDIPIDDWKSYEQLNQAILSILMIN